MADLSNSTGLRSFAASRRNGIGWGGVVTNAPSVRDQDAGRRGSGGQIDRQGRPRSAGLVPPEPLRKVRVILRQPVPTSRRSAGGKRTAV